MNAAKPVPPPPAQSAASTTARSAALPPHASAVPAAPAVARAAAPRQWNARLIAAAIALIAIGGLLGMFAVQAGRNGVLVITRPVKAGSALTAADLSVAQVAVGSDVTTMTQTQRDTVVGQLARTDLTPGTLVSPALITSSDGLVGDQRLVPLALKPGQMPARGLSAGAKVDIVFTPAANSTTAVSGASSSATTKAIPGYVVTVGSPSTSTGASVVDVRVDAASAEQVARFAATGTVVLVAYPTGS